MKQLIQFKQTPIFLTTLALVCVTLLPAVRAVVPPPDGGYPGFNTAEGQNALLNLTTGSANTAVGWFSLKSNVDNSFNTAVGAGTLLLNTAEENTAVGAAALLLNTTGEFNTALGATALLNNTSGSVNTATGAQALLNNTTGDSNTATGFNALLSNNEGVSNTATGAGALTSNTTGVDNTAIGSNALQANTIGSLNTVIGFNALSSNTQGSFNTAIGESALSAATGEGNIGVGAGAGILVTTANNVICIGAPGADQNDSCYIGNIFAGEVALDGVPVLVDSLGKVGVQISSRRFKNGIKPMDKASEALYALKPVTFHYKSDTKNTPQCGLIAEEVATVNPNLVVHDKKGELLTVRYDQVNAMLLNEFLKEHKKVEEQQATIAELKSTVAQQRTDFEAAVAQQQKQIEKLTAHVQDQASQIQKVSAQIEISMPPPQLAGNGQ